MAINLRQVNFTYTPHRNKKKNVYVLEDANLKIETNGEFIAVVGHTGSGKSTLIQLLNTLLLPTTGEVDIDGKIIKNKGNKNLREIKRKIGLVFQFAEYQLFEETVIRDIEFGPKNFKVEDYHNKSIDACKKVGLNESFFEKSPFRLSGGEMRKVAIAGILASDPDVLILDEPTVGLDPFTRSELMELLKTLNKNGKTIIVVTHDMEVVSRLAERVIVVNDTKIVYDGSKDELFKDDLLLEKHSLDLPDIVKMLKKVKEKLGLDIDVYKYTVEEAYLEIARALGNE